jgi:MFS family permease
MSATNPPVPPREISFRRLITTCISARILIDIGAQIFNPFLPIIAAGLNTDIITLGRMVSLRSATGLLAPAIGTLADRHGYRLIMRAALVVSAAGMFLFGISATVPVALVAMVLMGLGLAGFVPTLQAYLGARLPYAQRARGMGMLEYSWALTGIVGLSAIGLLIAATNWRIPFFLLAAGMIIMAFVFRTLPTTETARRARRTPHTETDATESAWSRITAFFYIEQNARSTYATILVASLNFFAAMQFMIIHGVWFADQFGFDARALGLVALLFGLFDLAASVSVSLFTDRFGKWRSVLVGTVGALIGYLLIPWLSFAVVPALLSAATARGFFEFAIVANFPLLSEQAPQQRGKIMSLGAAATLGASTVASLVAPLVYTRVGITGVAILSTGFSLAALVILLTLVHEQKDATP